MPGEYGPGPEESKWKPEQPADDFSEPIVYDISSLPNPNADKQSRESEARAKLKDVFDSDFSDKSSSANEEPPRNRENNSHASEPPHKKSSKPWWKKFSKDDSSMNDKGHPQNEQQQAQAEEGVVSTEIQRQSETTETKSEAKPLPLGRDAKIFENYLEKGFGSSGVYNRHPSVTEQMMEELQSNGMIPKEPDASLFDTYDLRKKSKGGWKAAVSNIWESANPSEINGTQGRIDLYHVEGKPNAGLAVLYNHNKKYELELAGWAVLNTKAEAFEEYKENKENKENKDDKDDKKNKFRPTDALREALKNSRIQHAAITNKAKPDEEVPSLGIPVAPAQNMEGVAEAVRKNMIAREEAMWRGQGRDWAETSHHAEHGAGQDEPFEPDNDPWTDQPEPKSHGHHGEHGANHGRDDGHASDANQSEQPTHSHDENRPLDDQPKKPESQHSDDELIDLGEYKTEHVGEEASVKPNESDTEETKPETETQPESEPAEAEAELKVEEEVERGKVELRSTSYMETKTGATESQDAIIDDPEQGLGAVLDGMGGHSNGREAAHTAAAIIKERLQGELDPAEALTKLKEAADEADEAIRKGNNSNPGGTTLAVVKRVEGGNQVAIAWAGDSRVYRVSGDGELEMLTLDDSKAQTSSSTETPMEIQERMSSINSQEELDEYGKINTSAAENFKRRNVVRGYLGLESKSSMPINTKLVDAKPGDKFIITSDGVHDNLTTSKIKEALAGATDAEAARALVLAAKDVADKGESFRAKPDDVSAVVMSFEAASAPAEEKVEPRPMRPDGRIEYSISGSGKEGVSKFTELMERAKAANPEFDNLTEQGELIMTQLSKSKVKALAAQANTKGEIRAIENELWDRDISDAETLGKHRRFKREQGDLKTTDTEDAGGRIRLEYLTERRKEIAKQKHIERLKAHQAKKKALGGSEAVEQSEEIAEEVRPEREEPAEVVVEDEVSAEDDTVNLLRQIDRLEGLGLVDEPEIEDLYDEAKRDGYIIENDAGKAEATDKPGANEVFEGLQSLYERQTEQLDEAERLGGEFERALQADDVEEKERALNEIVEAAVQAGLAKSDNNGIFGMSEPDDSILASRWFMRQIKDLVGRGDVATDDGAEVAPIEAEQDEERGEAVGSSQALSFEEAQLKIQEQLAKQEEQRAARIIALRDKKI